MDVLNPLAPRVGNRAAVADFHFPRWAGARWICSCGATGAAAIEGALHIEAQRMAAGFQPNPSLAEGGAR